MQLGFSLAAIAVASAASAFAQNTDPKEGVVPLPSAAGWNASLVHDNGETGIWTVRACNLFPQYGTPEIVGLDDRGRCWMMVHYSGKWTPLSTIEEGEWLGAAAHGDIDPRAPGAELYVGGKKGNLYQVRTYASGASDHRLIARFPGCEVHTLVAGDLDPRVDGQELLVFTRPGALYRVTPNGPHGEFESTLLQELPGRVRDAVVLPLREGEASPRIATVARVGELALLQIAADGPRWEVLHSAPVGRGRLSLAPPRAGRGVVLYSTQDDGVILRHGERPDGWQTEVVYRGAPGPRGVKAACFDADTTLEQLVVFGYSKEVELLTRRGARWTAETLFTDRAAGHWLDVIEIDSRNATPEIIGSGYGGRIFMLARPPGYGIDDGAAVRPDSPSTVERAAAPESASDQDSRQAATRTAAPIRAGPAPVRALFVAGEAGMQRLDPLRYGGGFQAKSALYETLLRRDETGRIAPGLAASWRVGDGGRSFTFTLREDARWHDGATLVAEDVVAHFRRVIGLPEHAWLRGLARVASVEAPSPMEVCFRLREPWDLRPDLCAINPCSVRGPATLDGSGEFVGPIGSGRWRYVETDERADAIVLESTTDGSRRISLASVPLQPILGVTTNAALEALRAGEVDVLADGWAELIPRAAFPGEPRSEGALSVPGSSVWYLSFALEGPTSSRALRRRIAAAIDRAALIDAVELGHADATAAWAARGNSSWPSAALPPPLPDDEGSPLQGESSLRFVALDNDRESLLAHAIAAQLRAAGLVVSVEKLAPRDLAARLESRTFDLRLERTWGLPYDPDLSLQARFLPSTRAPSAVDRRDFGVDPELRAQVERLARATDEGERFVLQTAIQRRIEANAPLVPLYAPRRLVIMRAGIRPPLIDNDLYRTGW